jgi:hypothetical protein
VPWGAYYSQVRAVQEGSYVYGVKALRSEEEIAQEKAASAARRTHKPKSQEAVNLAAPKYVAALPAEKGAHKRHKEVMEAEAEAVEALEWEVYA